MPLSLSLHSGWLRPDSVACMANNAHACKAQVQELKIGTQHTLVLQFIARH